MVDSSCFSQVSSSGFAVCYSTAGRSDGKSQESRLFARVSLCLRPLSVCTVIVLVSRAAAAVTAINSTFSIGVSFSFSLQS